MAEIHSMIEANLDAIQQYLQQQGYEIVVQPPVEINPQEQLLVSLGEKLVSQQIVLRLFWVQSVPGNKAQDSNEPQFLQFFVLLPFIASPQTQPDLMRLLFNLNATLDMAHFGLYENGMVYYRHVHVCANHRLDGEALVAILLSIELLLEMFLPAIRGIALGQKSLTQIQDEAKKILEHPEIPPKEA